MEELVKQAAATYRKLGSPDSETQMVIARLNRNLANYNLHYQKMRNFHWNIKGHNFFDLHAKFQDLYTQAFENIDKIAERIRVFGAAPSSTLKEYLEMSEIREVNSKLDAVEMVKETLQDFDKLLISLVDTLNVSTDIGDVGTVDLVNKLIKNIEKEHWMLTSWNSREL